MSDMPLGRWTTALPWLEAVEDEDESARASRRARCSPRCCWCCVGVGDRRRHLVLARPPGHAVTGAAAADQGRSPAPTRSSPTIPAGSTSPATAAPPMPPAPARTATPSSTSASLPRSAGRGRRAASTPVAEAKPPKPSRQSRRPRLQARADAAAPAPRARSSSSAPMARRPRPRPPGGCCRRASRQSPR